MLDTILFNQVPVECATKKHIDIIVRCEHLKVILSTIPPILEYSINPKISQQIILNLDNRVVVLLGHKQPSIRDECIECIGIEFQVPLPVYIEIDNVEVEHGAVGDHQVVGGVQDVY